MYIDILLGIIVLFHVFVSICIKFEVDLSKWSPAPMLEVVIQGVYETHGDSQNVLFTYQLQRQDNLSHPDQLHVGIIR